MLSVSAYRLSQTKQLSQVIVTLELVKISGVYQQNPSPVKTYKLINLLVLYGAYMSSISCGIGQSCVKDGFGIRYESVDGSRRDVIVCEEHITLLVDSDNINILWREDSPNYTLQPE